MHQRSLFREFRVFFAYTAFTLFQGFLLFLVRNYIGYLSRSYFVSFWLGFIVQATLMFFMIQEVYSKVLYRYEGLRTLSAMIFRWAFMLLVVLAIFTALTSPVADRDMMYSGILKFDFSTRIVEFGLIVLLFVFAKALALSWRECIFGIAAGTCFYCSAQLAAIALRNHYGNDFAELLSIMSPLLGIISLGIWTAYLYRAERHPRIVLKPGNPQLEEWNRVILQFLDR